MSMDQVTTNVKVLQLIKRHDGIIVRFFILGYPSRCKFMARYSVLLDGNYPDVNRILENKGEELSLDVNALSKPIALAISSLEEIKDDILELKGEVFFSCKDKKLTISTNLYRNEFDVNAIDFEFNLFAKHTKLIVDLDVKKVFYKDSKHPLFMELAENEIAMFLPLTKKGGN